MASLVGITGLATIILTLPTVSAETEAVDTVTITVPSACSMSGTITTGNEHTATVDSGTYVDDIGETTLKTICNDSNGFSIYAIGYTDDTYGNTKLKSSVGATSDVNTGIATSGNTSNWAMKLTSVSNDYTPTILSDTNGSFSSYHIIPSTYTKVATRTSVTDATNGSNIKTTYAVYMNPTQPAGTYTGKVKYTLVHPASHAEPFLPHAINCTSGKICYNPNTDEHEGTMGEQNVSSFVTLLASNYSRAGYGFAGWSDAFDYATNQNAKFYGPNEFVTLDTSKYTGEGKGLSLYAVWVKSAGSLQDASKVATLCGTGAGSLTTAPTNGTANLASVSALTDERDNQTYAIAKLADGKCWMIENLRLESTAEHNSDGTLAQGYNSSFIGLATAESEHFSYNDTTANSLYTTESNIEGKNTISGSYTNCRFPRYNNTNTSARASSPTANSGSMYSYGNYYTWHAAIADTTHYSSGDHGTTSICPTGWRLPIGAKSTADRSFGALSVALGGPEGGATANTSSTPTGEVMSTKFRSYPNNFLYSGNFTSSAGNRGGYGYYWSSTAESSRNSYALYLLSSDVSPGTLIGNKVYGYSIRCVSGS